MFDSHSSSSFRARPPSCHRRSTRRRRGRAPRDRRPLHRLPGPSHALRPWPRRCRWHHLLRQEFALFRQALQLFNPLLVASGGDGGLSRRLPAAAHLDDEAVPVGVQLRREGGAARQPVLRYEPAAPVPHAARVAQGAAPIGALAPLRRPLRPAVPAPPPSRRSVRHNRSPRRHLPRWPPRAKAASMARLWHRIRWRDRVFLLRHAYWSDQTGYAGQKKSGAGYFKIILKTG